MGMWASDSASAEVRKTFLLLYISQGLELNWIKESSSTTKADLFGQIYFEMIIKIGPVWLWKLNWIESE